MDKRNSEKKVVAVLLPSRKKLTRFLHYFEKLTRFGNFCKVNTFWMIYAKGYGHDSQRNFFLAFTETPQAFLPRSRRVAAKVFFFTQVKMEKTDQKQRNCRKVIFFCFSAVLQIQNRRTYSLI